MVRDSLFLRIPFADSSSYCICTTFTSSSTFVSTLARLVHLRRPPAVSHSGSRFRGWAPDLRLLWLQCVGNGRFRLAPMGIRRSSSRAPFLHLFRARDGSLLSPPIPLPRLSLSSDRCQCVLAAPASSMLGGVRAAACIHLAHPPFFCSAPSDACLASVRVPGHAILRLQGLA